MWKKTLNWLHEIGYKKITLLAMIFLSGMLVGGIVEYQQAYRDEKNFLGLIEPMRQNQTTYPLISPLLVYELPEATKEFAEYKTLDDKLTGYVHDQESQDNIEKVSVYYRDLTQGRWVGINEQEGYEPASMLKVAIMIAFFKETDTNPSVLSQKFSYSPALASEIGDVPFQASSSLKVGKSYTVRELIDAMIVNSDNGAKDTLLANIDQKSLNEVFSDLGIQNPAGATDYVMSTKTYSLFLRILYNSTYLSRSMSEDALEILTKATYQDGLVKGVPKGIPIAQKFGEHVYTNPDGTVGGVALSNCGIIYHPDHPYVLCIMTKGSDVQKLANAIADISHIVYTQVGLDQN